MFSIFKRWIARVKDGPVDWDELEATLIQSDLGIELAMRLLDKLKGEAVSAITIQKAVCGELLALWSCPIEEPALRPNSLNVWLIVGVNGTGKTTTTAKLAARYKQTGKKVFLVAADTFRAAAIDQLRLWAERLGVDIFCGKEDGDPAAAAYEGIVQARAAGADLVLIDTAGRLHNKENLMRELEKVRRVIAKHDTSFPHATFLVVDGTSGANTLSQAREFHAAVPLTGLIVTKLDSSAKGGSIAALKAELGLDTIWIGKGEAAGDIEGFNPELYVERFFGEEQARLLKSDESGAQEAINSVRRESPSQNFEKAAPSTTTVKSKLFGWFGNKK